MQQSGGLLLDAGLTASTPSFTESPHDRLKTEDLPFLTVAIHNDLEYNPFSTNYGGNYP